MRRHCDEVGVPLKEEKKNDLGFRRTRNRVSPSTTNFDWMMSSDQNAVTTILAHHNFRLVCGIGGYENWLTG